MFQQYLKPASWADIPHPPIAGVTPYQAIQPDGSDTGLFTGYFEPLLRGSFTKREPFIHAVYAPPTDLSMMPSRAEIAAGALAEKNLELLYVDDAVDLFFAHVQGSAAVEIKGDDDTTAQSNSPPFGRGWGRGRRNYDQGYGSVPAPNCLVPY